MAMDTDRLQQALAFALSDREQTRSHLELTQALPLAIVCKSLLDYMAEESLVYYSIEDGYRLTVSGVETYRKTLSQARAGSGGLLGIREDLTPEDREILFVLCMTHGVSLEQAARLEAGTYSPTSPPSTPTRIEELVALGYVARAEGGAYLPSDFAYLELARDDQTILDDRGLTPLDDQILDDLTRPRPSLRYLAGPAGGVRAVYARAWYLLHHGGIECTYVLGRGFSWETTGLGHSLHERGRLA